MLTIPLTNSESRVFLHLDWLLTEDREPSLPCYCPLHWYGAEEIIFLKCICVRVNETASGGICSRHAEPIDRADNRYGMYICRTLNKAVEV